MAAARTIQGAVALEAQRELWLHARGSARGDGELLGREGAHGIPAAGVKRQPEGVGGGAARGRGGSWGGLSGGCGVQRCSSGRVQRRSAALAECSSG